MAKAQSFGNRGYDRRVHATRQSSRYQPSRAEQCTAVQDFLCFIPPGAHSGLYHSCHDNVTDTKPDHPPIPTTPLTMYITNPENRLATPRKSGLC